MKNYLKFPIALLIVALGLLLSYCSEDDGLDTLGKEPTVTMRFFDITNLLKIAERDSMVTMQLNFVDSIRDTLQSLLAVSPSPTLDSVRLRDSLVAELDTLNNLITELRDTASTITSGNLAINSLTGEGAPGDLVFDSATSHTFPLSTTDDFSKFFINIDGQIDTLEVVYSRNTLKENSDIIIQALQLRVEAHTYDSIKMYCDDSLACTIFGDSPRQICLDSLTCISDDARLDIFF